ncbi:hypothetical protein BSBH6_02129 [Bacillus subtilis]|nr:hypothetical protein BSBH6_02129 [Bacillus subtilis]RPK25149.1 hypothetical protein BH5_01980 [Bacillus subtilis]
MANFILDLYDSDKTVGIVESSTFEFYLKYPIYPYGETTVK